MTKPRDRASRIRQGLNQIPAEMVEEIRRMVQVRGYERDLALALA